MNRLLICLVFIFGVSSTSFAKTGSEKANVGGTVYLELGLEPATLNPFTATDGYSQIVHAMVIDGLLDQDIDTFEFKPGIAEKWSVSKDGLTFSFQLRKDAKFHDGKPITSEDIKFSYDIIMDPAYKAVILRPFYKFIDKVTTDGPHKITFRVKKKYFKNLDFIGGMRILPKHKYKDPTKKFNKKIYSSGPYKLDKWEKGRRIILKRNDDWWGFKLAHNKGRYNFKKIIYRFIKEDNVKIEMLKKGKLDYLGMRPHLYEKLAKGKGWGTNVFKVKASNEGGKGYGYVGWNLRDERFKDPKVREAMSLLLNRKFIIDKFLHGLYEPEIGPWNPRSMYADPKVKADEYNPKKALKLFRSAGWSDSNKDGVLDKLINGKKIDFKITIITAAQETIKILTTYKEEAKKIGVVVDLKLVEWQTLLKLSNEGKFQGVALAWGGVVHLDPHQIWHSSTAVPGGSNRVHYKNAQVDKWIEQARGILDNKKRVPVLQKIYRQIATDRPYLFLFTPKYALYGHTKRMQKEKDTYRYGVGVNYWWVDKK